MDQLEILQRPILGVGWLDLTVSAGLLLIAVGIARWRRTGLVGSLVVGGIRTVVQLTLVGYVLVYIFSLDRWWLVVAALLAMVGVATREAVNRQERKPPALYGIAGLSLLAGSGLTLVFVGAAVVHVDPWYNPRYLIPLFGMIIGNAMNAAALAAERLDGEMQARKDEVEAYLALGAGPGRAAEEPVRRALRASMIPLINSLMVVGIVSLPGMMTGQIIAGASPLVAIRYQIVVMFMLASAVALSAAGVALGYRRHYFTEAEQLRFPGSEPA